MKYNLTNISLHCGLVGLSEMNEAGSIASQSQASLFYELV